MIRRIVTVSCRFVGLALLYFLVGRLGRRVDFVSEDMRVFWPQAGVALAGLVLLGVRYWPAVAAGSLLNSMMSPELPSFAALAAAMSPVDFSGQLSVMRQMVSHDPLVWRLAPGFAVGNTMSAAAGAWLLLRVGRFDPALGRLHDAYSFLLYAVLLAPIVAASVAVGNFVHAEPAAQAIWLPLWLKRWFGHAISNMVIAPVLMTWSRLPGPRWNLLRIGELSFLLAVLLTICLAGFTSRSPIGLLNYPVSYAPFPIVIWAALRFGPRGGSTATLLVSAIAVFGASQGAGPFVRGVSPAEVLVLLQIYLTVLALTGVFLGAVVTEKRGAASELERSREELRRLTARLQEAREEERAHVSREIHDELGQQLTGLKMSLHGLARKLGSAGDAAERCADLSRMADDAVKAVRRIASDLRPGILDDFGIVESMQWLAGDFEERFGIEARIDCRCEGVAPSKEQSTALFRILQEALTNVARHSEASRVEVRAECADGWFVLEVRDNGKGLRGDPAVSSLGIVGMRERATLLGGSFSAESLVLAGEVKGTCIRARIPVDSGGQETNASVRARNDE